MRIPNLNFLARRVNAPAVLENNKPTYSQERQTPAKRPCEIKSSPFSAEVFSFHTTWFARATCFHSIPRVAKAIPEKPECNWSHDNQQNKEDEEGIQCSLESAGQRLVTLPSYLYIALIFGSGNSQWKSCSRKDWGVNPGPLMSQLIGPGTVRRRSVEN